MPGTIAIGGVPCSVVPSSVDEYETEKGAGVRLALHCAWDKRYRVVAALRPTTTWTGNSIVRTPPFAYPDSPNLYAMRVPSIKGLGPGWSGNWITFKEAEISVEFETPSFDFTPTADPSTGGDPSGQPWTTTTFDVSAEVIKLPGGAYKLSNGEPLEETTTGRVLPAVQINMRRHFVPFVPLADGFTRIGSLNNTPMRFANQVFAPGQLMLAGLTSEVAGNTLGQTDYELVYKLLGRSESWNKFLGRDGNWYTATDSSGRTPFPTASLHLLP